MNIYQIMERMGSVATEADAEAAMQKAEDWYNETSKKDVIDWYESFRVSNQHAPDIFTEDEPAELVSNWSEIVIAYRAIDA